MAGSEKPRNFVEIVKTADQDYVLDFPARVGARPYVTYQDGEWLCLSVGPWENTETGDTIITTKEVDVTESEIREWVEESPLVKLRNREETPFSGYEDWVY